MPAARVLRGVRAGWWRSGRCWWFMSHKTTLKRLERLLDAQRRHQDDAARRERERLDAMTDEQLARSLAELERGLAVMQMTFTTGEGSQDDN